MLIKGVIDEDFVNYKVPSMIINTNTCTYKCNAESGNNCCQNSDLAKSPSIDVKIDALVDRYLKNDITKAICFAGLEPFDQLVDVIELIKKLRLERKCNDTVVIYTGYNKDEIQERLSLLKAFKNIVIKYGRYIPGQEKHYDDVLGIYLASPNQYAEVLS